MTAYITPGAEGNRALEEIHPKLLVSLWLFLDPAKSVTQLPITVLDHAIYLLQSRKAEFQAETGGELERRIYGGP
jgi:hypothetical protein